MSESREHERRKKQDQTFPGKKKISGQLLTEARVYREEEKKRQKENRVESESLKEDDMHLTLEHLTLPSHVHLVTEW